MFLKATPYTMYLSVSLCWGYLHPFLKHLDFQLWRKHWKSHGNLSINVEHDSFTILLTQTNHTTVKWLQYIDCTYSSSSFTRCNNECTKALKFTWSSLGMSSFFLMRSTKWATSTRMEQRTNFLSKDFSLNVRLDNSTCCGLKYSNLLPYLLFVL